MKIIFSKKCLEYESCGHPESPQRLFSTYEHLKDKDFEFISPSSCNKEELLLVHTKNLIDRIKNLEFFDPDTPTITGIFDYACLSVGGAIKAMELCLDGKSAFSLMRPPGHHAGRNTLGGFCYFNNIAVAVKKAMLLDKRVAILDIDCHHGNGTEDIFLGEKRVLYVSLHQVPLYPGTGLKSHKNCLNYPLSAGIKEKEYLVTLKNALSEIRDFLPDLLAISCGFDTYKDDPLTQMGLEIESYKKIAWLIAQTKIPCFFVLEGGYSSELKYCIYKFLEGLLA